MIARPDFGVLASTFIVAHAATEDAEATGALVSLLEQVEHNALERAAEEAEAAAREGCHHRVRPSDYASGATKAAWRIRQLKRGGRP